VKRQPHKKNPQLQPPNKKFFSSAEKSATPNQKIFWSATFNQKNSQLQPKKICDPNQKIFFQPPTKKWSAEKSTTPKQKICNPQPKIFQVQSR